MCDSPLIAVKYGIDPDTGKWRIKIKRPPIGFSLLDMYKQYGKENVLLIPCGKCASCTLARRKEWSVRCQCEAAQHEKNCFITLTYDDDHYPGHLVKDHLRKFVKAVRNSGYKCRFFGCGEVGKLGRAHYHIILFGFMPDDLYYIGTSDSGEALFQSDLIDSLWKKGRAVVQFFDGSVGSYVAGYTTKKLGDHSGFQIQSTHPGIGYQFALASKDIAMKYDKLYGSFGSSKLPRYFEKVLYGDSFYLDILKDERLKKANTSLYLQARDHGFTHIEDAIFYTRYFNEKKLESLVRFL